MFTYISCLLINPIIPRGLILRNILPPTKAALFLKPIDVTKNVKNRRMLAQVKHQRE